MGVARHEFGGGVGGEREMCWMAVGRWCNFFEDRIFCKTCSISCELTVTL